MFHRTARVLQHVPLAERTFRVRLECPDIAASIQQVTEEVLICMARQLHKETGMSKLCIAGGVGLNSVANHRILRETPFEDVFIQPAAGDGGGALGAALWADNMLLGNKRRFRMDHAYWGRAYSDAETQQFLDENGIPYQRIENDDRYFNDLSTRWSLMLNEARATIPDPQAGGPRGAESSSSSKPSVS